MNLRRLEHFEALYRLRSFNLAADEQAVTPSALSKSIQKLEDELGLILFDRTTRSVLPTAAAEQLLPRAVQLTRDADDMRREAQMLSGAVTGAITIGADPVSIEALLPRALARSLAQAPDLRPTIRSGDQSALVARLLQREVDFVVLGALEFEAIQTDEALTIQRLPGEPSVILMRAGHSLIRDEAPPMTYLDYPWVMPGFAADAFAFIPPPFRDEMLRRGFPQIRLESFAACIDLVRRSDVLAGAPLSIGLSSGAGQGIDMVTYPFRVETSYALLRLRGRTLSPSARHLIDSVNAVAQDNAAHPRVAEFRARQASGWSPR